MVISGRQSGFRKILQKLNFLTEDKQFTLFSNRDILKLVIPLFIEQFLFILVGSADKLMVAGLGEASISAVSLVDMFNNSISSILFALATGGAVVVSQCLGAGNLTRARENAKQLLAILLISGTITCFILELFLENVVRVLYGELQPDVHTAVLSYFKITLASMPFVAVYGGCTALFRAMNSTRITMYISFISNIINIIGNALLIYVFSMGVAGAAWATLLARLVALAIILVMITNKSRPVFISLKKGFRLSWHLAKRILSIGIPGGIENGVFQFGRVFVLGLIATFGTREIAANAIANTIDIFGCIAGSVFSLAVVTVVGKAVGAGNEKQIRYYVGKMMKMAYASHIMWSIIVFALTPFILQCFSKIDPETRHLAWYLILIHNGLGVFMWPGSFVFPNVLRSMNDVRVVMFISIGSMLVVRLGFSHLIASWINSGVLAVWIAMVFDWIVRITGFLWRYKSNAWLRLAHITPQKNEISGIKD